MTLGAQLPKPATSQVETSHPRIAHRMQSFAANEVAVFHDGRRKRGAKVVRLVAPDLPSGASVEANNRTFSRGREGADATHGGEIDPITRDCRRGIDGRQAIKRPDEI